MVRVSALALARASVRASVRVMALAPGWALALVRESEPELAQEWARVSAPEWALASVQVPGSAWGRVPGCCCRRRHRRRSRL